MINSSLVYKIKFTALTDSQERIYGKNAWVHGFNVCPKVGGSGKTFTDEKIVNRMLRNIRSATHYGVEFKCEIVTFKLTFISVSDGYI